MITFLYNIYPFKKAGHSLLANLLLPTRANQAAGSIKGLWIVLESLYPDLQTRTEATSQRTHVQIEAYVP